MNQPFDYEAAMKELEKLEITVSLESSEMMRIRVNNTELVERWRIRSRR